MNLIIKQPNGSYREIEVNKNTTFTPKEGEQYFLDNSKNPGYALNLIDGESTIQLTLGTNPKLKLTFDGMADLIKSNGEVNKTVLSVIYDKEGVTDLKETVLNPDFKSDDIIKDLEARFDENLANADKPYGVIIDDFGSLASAMEASAAGEVLSDSSTTPNATDNDIPLDLNPGERPDGFRTTKSILNVPGTGGTPTPNDPEDTGTSVSPSTTVTSTVSLSATDTNEAAGTVTFTATLSNPVVAGDTPVVIHTKLGDITITEGSTGTLEVTNPNTEDVYKDASTLDNSITSVEGGNFEKLTPNTNTVTADIDDTIDDTTVTLTATESVEAGEDITYTASVDHKPETDLVITLSNGSEITIKAGETTGSVTVASADDVYGQTDGKTETVSITGTTGGNYENLDTSDTAKTTVTEPTADETTVSLSATDTNEAAGTVTFTATLSNPVVAGDTPVVIHTKLGDITITEGSTGTLEVTNPNTEDVYKDASTLDNSITSVEGGNFEKLTPNTNTVTADIDDTIDDTTVTLTATESVEAGEDITYTASVDHKPETDLVITLSNGSEITIKAGETTGSVTVASADDVYGQTDGKTETVSITGTTGGNYENLDTSDTAKTTVTEPTADETTVSLSATDTNEAAGTVTFTATLSNPVVAGDTPVVIHTKLGDITITEGSTGTLEVTNPNTEDVYKDASTLDNSITSVEGGNFEKLTPNTNTVTADIDDTIDDTTVTLTATESVEAGEDITYTASVDHKPETDLVITLSNGSEITIKAGETTGSVTVASADDVYGQTDGKTETVSITGTTGGNYENLDTSDTAKTTVTEPTADETTVSLSATDTNEAAGTVTFTATLSNPVVAGDTPVVIHTKLGDITITEGSTGTLEVTNPNTEDVYKDASTLDNSITSVEGGNFEKLTPNTNTVTADIDDTIDDTTVTLTATESVEAGEDITYTASVDHKPETDLVITLSNGSEITIKAGETTGSVTVASADDVYGQTDGKTETVSITGTTGGNYENLDTSDTAKTTVTEPTADETTVSLSATDTNEAAGTVTFTATLSNPVVAGDTPVVIHTKLGDITITEGSTGTLEVTNPNTEDVYKDASTLDNSITSVEGGNFEKLTPNTNTVTADIDDTIDDTTVTLTATESVEAGEDITYTASVDHKPETDLVITLSNGSEITIKAGETTGSVTVASADDVYGQTDGKTETVSITGTTGGNYENLDTSDTAKTTVTEPTADETTVSLSATDTNEAAGTVTFTATLSNPVVAGDTPVVIHTKLGDITITEGSTGTLEVTNPNTEDVYKDASTLDNSITSVEGGNFEKLTPNTNTVTADIDDTIDDTTVTLTATESVEAGEDITYTASVDHKPETDLVITLSNGSEITIKAGETTGSVTVASADDVYGQTDGKTETVSITGTTGGNYENLDTSDTAKTTVTEPTADETTVSLSATDTNEAAGTVTFTATLSNPVVAGDTPVVIHTKLGDITITEGSTGTLEVTNPNTEDVYKDASTLDNSITSVEGGNFEKLTPNTNTVTADIDDTIDDTTVTLTATESVEAGEDITYTASVDHKPETDLVITLSNGSEITIKAGETTGSVTVASADDVYGQTDGKTETVSITGTTGGNYENLDTSDTAKTTVTEPTADETTVSLSATDTNEAAGTVTFTATLSNPVVAGDTPVVIHTKLGDITITEGSTGTLEVTNPNTEDVYKDASTLDNSITSVEGGNFEKLTPNTNTVTADIDDTIDDTTVTLTATESVEAGEDITYTASVDHKPETDLVITLSNGSEITIKAGETTGSVTVASADDVYGQTDGKTETVSITGTTGGNYENLDTSDTAKTTVTEPTADETTVSLSATDTNEAAGTVTFTATLSNPVVAGDTPVVIHTKLGDITITEGSTGTLEVTNPNTEDVYKDASTLDNSITSVEGGNFEKLTPNTNTVTADIDDTIDDTTVTLTATESVEAGEDITYTASVDHKPETDLVITLSNGSEITIKAGETTGSVTVASADDVYGQTDGKTETVSITGTTGGNYENLDTSDTAKTTVTEPTADETTVSLSATDTNEAAGTVTFTATLSNPVVAGDTPVVIHTKLGDITITEGSTGTLEVTNPNTEDVYKDASTLDNSITSVEGGNFEKLTPNTNTVTADIDDTIDDTTVTLTATESVEAGEDITYTASVDHKPETDLVITLSNGSEITIKAGETTGSVTVASADDVYGQTDGKTETVSITGTTGGNYENLDTSDTAKTTVTEPTADETTVSLSATDTNEAAGTVTFTATLSNPVVAGDTPVVIHTKLGDITITEGSTGTLEVTNPNTEDVYKDASTLDNSITSVEGGNFEKLTPNTNTVTADIDDTIDDTTVTLTATESVEAGEDITYTASVDHKPETDLVITLSNGSEITIKAGETTGSVTVASADDVYGQTDGKTETVSITGTTGGNYENLDTSDTAKTTVTEPTADETTVSLSATDTNEAAGTVTFTATLSNPVVAGDTPVVIHTKLGDITITEGSTGTLEVTNPNTEDVYKDASTLDNSITSVEGGNFEKLTPNTNTVTADIDDTIDDTTVTLTATESVEAGEDITYTASVDHKPETDLVITLSNGSEITIKAGETTGSVTVASADDVYGQTDGKTETVSITGTTGGNYENLDTSDTAKTTVTEPTADETTVSLSATDTNEAAGTVTFTATLSNPVVAGDTPVVIHTKLGDITITEGSTGTLEVTNPNTEDVYKDASTLDNSITSVEGGNFEKLTPNTNTVTADIDDTIDDTTVTLTATESVEAGEDITYTASVDHKPETDLVITLSNGSEITIKAGETTGSVTVASADDVYGQTDGKTETVSITGTTGGNYENLDTSDTAKTTVTEPTADETTVSLSATDTNEAAGTVTFTATLSNPVVAGDTPVVIHTKLGDITITEGSTGTLEVTNPNTEDVYKDASTLDNSITSVEGGNFEKLTPNTNTVTADIDDTIDDTTVTLTATESVEAGEDITYTASVDHKPETDLVITLSNGSEITIKAGETTGSVTVASADDVYGQTDGKTETVSITGTTGGNYENLDTSDTAKTTVTEPTADETTVSLSATDTNEAAGTVTFTATLSNPVVAGDTPVVIHTKLGDITITEGSTGTLEVTNPNTEDVYKDASTLDNSITSVEGGNFEKLTPNTNTVTADIDDTIDDTTVTLTATESVEAGEDITYTASVDHKPETDLVITLSNGSEITIKAGETTGSVTVASADDVYGQTDGKTETVSITGTTGGNYENLDTSDTAKTTVTEPTADETTVSLSATDTNEAAGTVTFTATLSNPVVAGDTPVVIHTKLGDITITEGSTGTLEVTNPNTEDVYKDASTLDNSITSVEGGNFEKLTPNTNTVTADIDDTIDDTTVTLTATESVEAGEDITYTASVDHKPETDLVITLSNGSEITIKAGETTGSVTVASADDVYGQTDGKTETVSITGTTGGNYENLDTSDTAKTTVTEPTADETTVSLSATDTNEAAGTVTFTATLSNPVVAGDTPVVIHTKLGDITITEGSTGTLEVTNPNTEDVYKDASTLDNSITSVEGGNFEKLTPNTNTVTADIDDTIDDTTVTLTATESVEAGEDITYTASVDHKPETDLVITLSNGSEITIKAGETTGSVTVASADDVYGQTDGKTETVSITGTTGGNYENLDTSDTAKTTVTEPTADETTVSLSATDTNEAAGTVTFTATLSNPVVAGDTPVVIHTKLGDITITEGSTGTLEVTNPNTEDVYKDASTLDNSITSVEGGNFEKLTPNTNTVTADIDDTIDDTTVTLTATESVEAGEDITYTASVDHKPETDLVITLSNGSEITIKAGETTGSVTVASADDVYGQTDGKTETVSITGTTGGNYENLDTSDTAKTTVTEPTADETTVSLSATDTNEAAGTVTFTATLSNPVVAGDTPVVIHTKLGDITITEGSTGTLEVTNPNTEDVYKDASTLDNSITSVEGGNFEKLTPNTNTVTADIDDTITPIDITIDAVATAPKIIDVTTVNQDGTGVTATAYNRDGNETDVYIKNDPAGLGVKGTAWYTNEDSELGHDEKIVFDFTNDVNSLDVSFAWRNNQETAQMTFSNDGVQIGYATVSGGGSDVDAVVRYFDMNNNLLKEVPAQGGTDRIDLAYTFEFPDANGKPMAFDNVEFSAPNEQDDYLIHEISYTEVIDPEVTNISTTDGKITFNIQIDEDYPPQGKATAIVEVNGQEYEVDLNATGRGTLTLDAKDFPDLSNVDIQVKEIIGGNYEKVNTASESFDLSDSFKDDFKSTDDVININEDQTYVLTETDFGDIGTGVKEFKVTEIPSEGTLYLTVHKGETVIDANGNSHVITHDTQIEVNSGQVISLANVAAGNLVYVPKEDSDNDVSFKFQIGDGEGTFKDVDYTTDINIKAVADAPTASINVTKIESTSGEHNQGGNGSGNSNSDSLDVLQAPHEGTGKDGNLDSNLNYSGTNDIVKDYQNVNASSITTDKGNDTLEFQSLNNGKNINTGDGDDKVVVNQSSSANVQLGEGNNTYTVAGSLNQGSTQSGAGNDTFIVNQGTNETTLNLGDGNNTISVGESLNRSNVSTGSGNDTLIVGNNSDGNTVSTGSGDDVVQFNGNVQDTRVDLGDGNDTINLSSDSDVNFNINTIIDGGKGQDTLHFSGKMEDYKVSVGVDQGEDHLISWEEYVQMNKDPEGYKNKEFTIYEVDGNGTLQGSKFVVKNIENVVFESDKDSGTIETTEEYNVDFNAALNDVDGSESLTVTITNLPEGAEFTSSNSSYTLTNNNDGTWTVNLPDGTKDISDSIKMTVPKGTENIDLGITARATETNDNEDGTNYKESTDSDALVYSEDESKTLDFGQVNVNLAITIDISNSMADDNKLALAKQSIINMINNYDDAGNVKVLLTTFGDYGNTLSSGGEVWLDANTAINLINNLQADGGTNYDDALLKVINSLKDNPAPLNGETISYFVSDGKPTYGMSEYNGTYYRDGNGYSLSSVNDDIATQWKDLGFDKAYSIGIGDNSITTYLEEISNSDNDVIIVNDADDLDVTLQNTVESTIHGDVSDNITGGDGEKTINSIVVDGVTHTVSEATDNVLSLNTSAGGTLKFNFETGEYSYSGTNKDIVEDKESFTVNASDEDGDTTSFDVNINITNTIDNVASAPSLYFSVEDNGSQEIENNYNYEKWDSSLYGESYTNSNDYVNIKNDVKGWLGTFDGDDVVNVGDDVILNGNIDLGKGDDFITIKDKVGSYLDWVKIDGGEGNDSIYLKGYTINDYYKNEDNIQNKISNFENIKCSDGVVKGDASVFNTSPLSTTVYNYTITLAALLSDVDGSESLSKVTLDNIPDTITSVKDSSGNVYDVSGGTVQLPIEDAKEEEFTFVSTKHLESSEVNSMTASVTSTESENDAQATVTTSAKISIEGDEHANTITGTDANEHIDGKGGADIIDAGAGDDTIVFNGTEKSIDGGTGNDTLIMNNDTIDLEDILKHTEIKNIENIDLTNNHAQEMNINLDDILDITDENHELKIFGDSDDKVTFDDKSNWTNQGTETIDGETFNVYQGTVGTSNVKVLIDDDVSVTPDV